MSLELEDVTSGYFEDIDILIDVTMRAEEGKITTIIGPNGAGKSTLLKTVFGFLKPKKGKVVYAGEDITGLSPHVVLNRGLSYIPQERSIFPHMAVEENLMLGGWIFRGDKEKIDGALEEIYEKFPNLSGKRKSRAGFLSGGEGKMLEIARGLIVNPKLVLLDEPTAGLAPRIAKQIYDKVAELSKGGITILLVDQNVRQAVALADYVVVIELGKVGGTGPKEDFETNLKDLIRSWWIG
ncbi:MAG: ATP-binding cassette domain-containing protein [Nitrososphaeria archaeon]|nr:ATP-binding cassette domain-containing protein [Nitrososphaeria archaeon]NIQ32476.1 ATP-binding cassette domain-containing protein [Nitrososphaeria archaeon]